MNNNPKAETPENDLAKIRGNYEVDHWSKKYGVSTEDLKKLGNHLGIQDKIIKTLFKKKVFEF